MKNKLFILSLLGLVLFVTACGNQNNSSSSESSSDSYISGSESSQSTISSNSSSSSISSETVSVKTQLKKYLQACFENQNYTIVDDELTRRYLPNAYYLEGEYETPIGYAEDETGI